MEKKLKMVGQIKNDDKTLEMTSRVYNRHGICPTISCCGGGNTEPKVIKKWKKNTNN